MATFGVRQKRNKTTPADVASTPQPALSEDALASMAAAAEHRAAAAARINAGRRDNEIGANP